MIAAIEGFAVAGGLEIALACDLIVAAEGAKLGIPESKRSLVAAGGALLRLPQRMPYHAVMELALTGDTFPAERFHELGLVNRLAPPGAAVDVALELAEAIGRNGPLALAAAKRILQEQFDWSAEEMWDKQGAIAGPVMVSEDAKEGALGLQGEARAALAGALVPLTRSLAEGLLPVRRRERRRAAEAEDRRALLQRDRMAVRPWIRHEDVRAGDGLEPLAVERELGSPARDEVELLRDPRPPRCAARRRPRPPSGDICVAAKRADSERHPHRQPASACSDRGCARSRRDGRPGGFCDLIRRRWVGV